MDECQQRVEELQTLLYQSELKREKAESQAAIYKRRFNALKLQVQEQDDEDGEIKGIDAKAVDPLLDVRKELDEMRALVDERGRTLNERADKWTARMNAPQPVPKTVTARDIASLFKQPEPVEKNKKNPHRFLAYKENAYIK